MSMFPSVPRSNSYLPLIVPVLLGLSGLCAVPMANAIPSGQTWVFDSAEDFAAGATDALVITEDGALSVGNETKTDPFLYATNHRYGTVSKIDTRTGNEVSRYPACVNGIGNVGLCPTDSSATNYVHGYCNWSSVGTCPSRSVVDLDGNVWIANRAFGSQASVTKIAAGASRCIDRNLNGVIETSSDLNGNGKIDLSESSSMIHTGTFGVDEYLGQADECVLFTVPVDATNAVARGLAVGPDNRIWVGMHNTKKVHALNNTTGATVATVDLNPTRIYGLATDSLGYLYNSELSGGRIQQVLTSTGAIVKTVDTPYSQYGIAVEESSQVVWTGVWENSGAVLRVDMAAGT